MSSTDYQARLAIADRYGSFDLYATGAVIVSGSLALRHHAEIERLTAAGVDSLRTRIVKRTSRELVLDCTEPLPAGQDLATRETAYALAVGRPGTWTTRFGGGTHVWKNAIVESVEILTRGFELIGAGAVSGSTRTLIARWVILRQQEASS